MTSPDTSGQSFDVIVVGLGAMGSAAARVLSARGLRVLGLDRFQRGHTLGSSHGETRIIRRAYYEHRDYVPLVQRAFELWGDLEREAKQDLLRITGGLWAGAPDSALVAGSVQSARVHGIVHEVLDGREIRYRFPAWRPHEGQVGVYEPGAGFLFPERCVEAFLSLAEQAGSCLQFQSRVTGWSATESGVWVDTTDGSFAADRVVLCAGAWTGKLVATLGPLLRTERCTVFWLQPVERARDFASDRFPAWLWEDHLGSTWYGVPHVSLPGAKLALHHGREWCDPDRLNRDVTDADEAQVRAFVRRYIPTLDGPVVGSSVCLYTDSPDDHFLVDRHPGWRRVAFACGFSGHGFKFASVIGEILADLTMDRPPNAAAAFLSLARLARQQPLAAG